MQAARLEFVNLRTAPQQVPVQQPCRGYGGPIVGFTRQDKTRSFVAFRYLRQSAQYRLRWRKIGRRNVEPFSNLQRPFERQRPWRDPVCWAAQQPLDFADARSPLLDNRPDFTIAHLSAHRCTCHIVEIARQTRDFRTGYNDAQIFPVIITCSPKILIGDVESAHQSVRAIGDEDFLMIADDIAQALAGTEAMISSARIGQFVKETVANCRGAKAVDDQLHLHPAMCRLDQRRPDVASNRIVGKHIEEHLNGLFRHRDQAQHRIKPVVRGMHQMELMASNLKLLSGKPRGA